MPNTWEDLEKLEENWDSYKAKPTTPEAIATGKMFERVLKECPPQFFPTADGGVSFEFWFKRPDEGIDITLNFYIDAEGEVEGIYFG